MASTPTELAALDALVRAAQGGDEAAFDALARQVMGRLRRWAAVKTGSPDDADEVVQRTLVRVYRGLRSFDGRARFTTWLYRVTANVAAELHRSRAVKEQRMEDLGRERAGREVAASDPHRALESEEIARIVRRFFVELPERQREVFDLVDLQGFQPTEAAEMLEMNRSTLRVHLHRARRAIREAILESHPTIAEEFSR